MQINQSDISDAVKAGFITQEQAEQLWHFWQAEQKDVVSFRFSHILYYLGGLIAIAAVTLFVTQAWDELQGIPLLLIAGILFAVGLGLTHYFLQKNLRIPAGIMAVFSLALVPLIVYNIQLLIGFLPHDNFVYSDFHTQIDWYWVNMELATLLVGVIMFYIYRFPFLVFPIGVILWYMSMDLWPLFFNMKEYTYVDRLFFSMIFGLFVLCIAVYIDFRYENDRQDYAFWLYIFGVIMFWGGLSGQNSDNEWSKLIYCFINILLILAGAFLNRRVFVIFGVVGIMGYLSHLAFSVFANSLGFPVVMILLGIAIIFLAIFYTRIENRLNAFMRPYLPRKLLDRR